MEIEIILLEIANILFPTILLFFLVVSPQILVHQLLESVIKIHNFIYSEGLWLLLRKHPLRWLPSYLCLFHKIFLDLYYHRLYAWGLGLRIPLAQLALLRALLRTGNFNALISPEQILEFCWYSDLALCFLGPVNIVFTLSLTATVVLIPGLLSSNPRRLRLLEYVVLTRISQRWVGSLLENQIPRTRLAKTVIGRPEYQGPDPRSLRPKIQRSTQATLAVVGVISVGFMIDNSLIVRENLRLGRENLRLGQRNTELQAQDQAHRHGQEIQAQAQKHQLDQQKLADKHTRKMKKLQLEQEKNRSGRWPWQK